MRRSSAAAIALLAAGLLLCLVAGGASAKLKYAADGSFSGPFGNDGPSSIDVNPDTGNVYVVDPNQNVIGIFNATGTSVGQIKGMKGEASVRTEWSPSPITIDRSNGVNDGYIYVGDVKADVIRIFTPTGVYVGELKGTNSPAGSFINPGGLAVDKNGALYISDTGHQVYVKYVPVGGIVEEADYAFSFSDLENAPTPSRIAVDTAGDLYVATGATAAKFGPTGLFLGGFGEYYVADIRADFNHDELITANNYFSFSYDPDGTRKAEIPAGPTVIAVNEATGRIYMGRQGYGDISIYRRQDLPNGTTGGVKDITNTTATLEGVIDRDEGEPVTGCIFEYGTDTTYGRTVQCDQTLPLTGQTTAVTAKPTKLLPGTLYHYRVAPSNGDGINQDAEDRTFQTEEPPLIEGFSVTNLQADSVTLNAKINPKGSPTTYHFEHGPTVAYGNISPIPDEAIGSGETAVSVALDIENLPGATYHFRVVATNQWGTVVTANQSFDFFPPSCPNAHVRQETASNYLPDCRAYELASPEDAGGTTISGASGPTSPFATGPSRIAFTGMFGTVPGTGEPANTTGDLYVATRGTAGWTTKYIGRPGSESLTDGGPPGTFGEGVDKAQVGVGSDPAMDRIVQWAGGADPRDASSNAPYVYTADGKRIGRLPTTFDETPGAVEGMDCVGTPAAGFGCQGETILSEDLGHFVFSTKKFKYLPAGITTSPGSAYDNDINADTVTLISRNEAGENIGDQPGEAGSDEWIKFPAISTDGSRILMRTSKRLFIRVDDLVTYDITEGHTYTFAGMPNDGERVYLTSDEKLTTEDQDTSTDLYMWTTSDQAMKLISIGDEGQGNTDSCVTGGEWTVKCGTRLIEFKETGQQTEAGMFGSGLTDNTVAGESGDIYFYSPDQLDGDRGLQNFRNLYVYRKGQVMHVAMLKDGGYCLPENVYQGVSCSKGPVGRIQVTPDGGHVAFLSHSRLTAFNNYAYGICDRLGGKCNFDAAEMYTWTPQKREITCVSCPADGAQPTTHVYASQNGLFLTDDGRAFFSTADPLSRRDTNNIVDVYEYVDGRAQLISPGVGDVTPDLGQTGLAFRIKPGLIGVSADGTDAYFATYEVLVGQDRNGAQIKIYDARVGSGIPFSPPPPPCPSADECHGDSSRSPTPLEVGTGARIKDDKVVRTTRKKGGKCRTKAAKKKAGKKACKKKKKSSRRAGK